MILGEKVSWIKDIVSASPLLQKDTYPELIATKIKTPRTGKGFRWHREYENHAGLYLRSTKVLLPSTRFVDAGHILIIPRLTKSPKNWNSCAKPGMRRQRL